jgi:hypothetical protein
MDYSILKDQLVDSPILSWAAKPVAVGFISSQKGKK